MDRALEINFKDLDNVRITRDKGYRVHFSINGERFMASNMDVDQENFYALFRENGNEAVKPREIIVSQWGDVPPVPYISRTKVYSQANARAWILRLAGRGVVHITNDEGRKLSKLEIFRTFSTEDLEAFLNVSYNRSPCISCSENTRCPVCKRAGEKVSHCMNCFK